MWLSSLLRKGRDHGYAKAYDQWWSEVFPALVNEDAIGPKINPFKEFYWKQFGGGHDEDLFKKMDPTPQLNRAP